MLVLTADASDIIEDVLESPEVPEGAGMRITTVPVSRDGGGPPAGGLQMAIVAEPDTTDEVIESSGARVFLEDGLASALADKTLDAQVDKGQIQFMIGEQG